MRISERRGSGTENAFKLIIYKSLAIMFAQNLSTRLHVRLRRKKNLKMLIDVLEALLECILRHANCPRKTSS